MCQPIFAGTIVDSRHCPTGTIAVNRHYSTGTIEGPHYCTLLQHIVGAGRPGGVSRQVILEPGIGQFREFEPRRVHTRINSWGRFSCAQNDLRKTRERELAASTR